MPGGPFTAARTADQVVNFDRAMRDLAAFWAQYAESYADRGVFRIAGSRHDQVSSAGFVPVLPADNPYVSVTVPYAPLRRRDASAAAAHPDRALFISWPNYADGWAAEALTRYRGDLVVYAGEDRGGCCGDDRFFRLLRKEWSPAGASPHHRTWWGINDRLVAYRRRPAKQLRPGHAADATPAKKGAA